MATSLIQQNDAARLAQHLSERTKARRQRDEWRQKYEELLAELPEDAVVLVGDEAKAIEALRERKLDIGKLPSLVETLEGTNADLKLKVNDFESKGMYGDFSQTSGYNADAVAGVVKAEHLHEEMKDRTVDTVDAQGKKTGSKTEKTLMVRKAADPKATLVPFDDFVNANVAYMWPALKAKPDTGNGNGNQSNGYNRNSMPVVEQGPTNRTGAPNNPVTQFLQNANAAMEAQSSPLQYGANRGAQPAPTGTRRTPGRHQ